ncbi:HlyD family secretion protein [Thermonema rossianum]|uniref:HlyD family secretion protein n=1 Tax=Thermonema rossianum TaxID=55505 RepID=UPI00056FEC1F|nr:HlyD family efflux transporter periplasmic adaptor subunit [Thermonema rossianum]
MLKISKESIENEYIERRVYAFRLLQTPRSARNFAKVLVGLFAFGLLTLFLPWTQNIPASGKVTAFFPKDRPQEVPAVIGGRIQQWYVQEGQFVNRGDTLLRIGEIKPEYFDPDLLERLREQVVAKEAAIEATKANIEALKQRLPVLRQAANLSLQKAENKVKQYRLKVSSDSSNYQAQLVNFQLAENQLRRYDTLYQKGLISLTDYQKRQLKYQESQAKLIKAENDYLGSQQEYLNALIELSSIRAEYREKILKAEAELRNYESYLANAQLELAAYRNKYASTVIRNENYYILAPQSGYVVKAMSQGIGEIVKEGEPVVQIQPARPQKAVELYVKAMDVPLITPGREVRIEFAGWPAFQFSGWPSVSVGTFAGRVKVIDYVSQPDGTYRILALPDATNDPEWPEQLRIGSAVRAFILLDDVPVWYEIWRQLNGFPPSLKEAPDEKGDKDKGAKKK